MLWLVHEAAGDLEAAAHAPEYILSGLSRQGSRSTAASSSSIERSYCARGML